MKNGSQAVAGTLPLLQAMGTTTGSIEAAQGSICIRKRFANGSAGGKHYSFQVGAYFW